MTREELSARRLVMLHRGRRGNPDVWLADSARGLVVVKDYAARPRWYRLCLGRPALRREHRAYAALAGLACVPKCHGWLDRDALVFEHRAGPRLSRRRLWTFDREFFAAALGAVESLHARGVVHLDLGHRSNLRADLAGAPVLIDFGAALALSPRGPLSRAVLRALGWLDRRAIRKWGQRFAALQEPELARGTSGGGNGAKRPM
jgi:hypothetical protein